MEQTKELKKIVETMKEEDMKELTRILNLSVILQKEVLTIEEVALYTGYKVSYLYKLNSSTIDFPVYSCNSTKGNLFFKRKELEEWMTKYRRNNFIQHKQQIEAYFSKKVA